MDLGCSAGPGVSLLQQCGLPSNAALLELLSNPFADPHGEKTLQQHQQQNQEYQQQDQQLSRFETGNNAANTFANNAAAQPTFIAPSALTPSSAAPEAVPARPSVASSDSHSSISSAPGSQRWQDSPFSNNTLLSSPATSITTAPPLPHSAILSPPSLDDDSSLILSPPGQDTKPLSLSSLLLLSSSPPPCRPPLQSTIPDPEPVDTCTEPTKRRRGRPRLSEVSNTWRDNSTRVQRAVPARDTIASATNLNKAHQKATAAAARRASTASVSGADDCSKNDNTTTTTPTTTTTTVINDKKNRIRARNREAAHKCRQKKQKGIEELQSQEAVAENINKTLHSEAAMLRSEILMLKNMVLEHGGCGCSYIEEYISGAARSLVQSSISSMAATPGGAARAAAAGGGASLMNDHSDVSGGGGGSGPDGDGYVDWDMFDMDCKPGPATTAAATHMGGSESGFSQACLDDVSVVTHSTRAHSCGGEGRGT